MPISTRAMRATMRFLSSARQRRAERQLDAEAGGDLLRRLLDAREPLLWVFDQQPPADRDRRRRDDLAALDQRELGGAAADVDVEDA